MLKAVADAAQKLALLRAAEARVKEDTANRAEARADEALVQESFILAAYSLAFDLVGPVLKHGLIVTNSGSKYRASPQDGGMLRLAFTDHKGGYWLLPNIDVPVEVFVQLMIDLPELLETLEVK